MYTQQTKCAKGEEAFLSLEEFVALYWAMVGSHTPAAIRLLFTIVDADGDGVLSAADVVVCGVFWGLACAQ